MFPDTDGTVAVHNGEKDKARCCLHSGRHDGLPACGRTEYTHISWHRQRYAVFYNDGFPGDGGDTQSPVDTLLCAVYIG